MTAELEVSNSENSCNVDEHVHGEHCHHGDTHHDDEAVGEEETDEEENNEDEDAEANEDDTEEILNRGEKKARKLLSKSGMKAVAGIERVTIKRGRMIFAIANPTVFKTSNDNYIVFGEAKVEDSALRAQAIASQRLAATVSSTACQATDETLNDEEPVDAGDLDEKDITIVMEQAGVSRSKAINSLKENSGDIVNTIMSLTT